jgi:hypothetical protein
MRNNDERQTDTLWTYKEVSWFLKRAITTIRRDVMLKRIPHHHVGSSVRFFKEEIIEYVKSSKNNDNSCEGD